MASSPPLFIDPDESNFAQNLNYLAQSAMRAWYRGTNASGKSPSATGADKALFVYTVPASYWGSGQGNIQKLRIRAGGSFAANGNNKTLKIIANATAPAVDGTVSDGTTIATTGVTTGNATAWFLEAEVIRTGSGAQLGYSVAAVDGATAKALTVPTALAIAEGSAITLCVTGNAATTATDILCNYFEVVACA